MQSTIQVILKQYSFNNRLFKNVLDGISDEQSTHRLSEQTNHIRWIAGHLTISRYRNCLRAGLGAEEYPYINKFVNKDMPPPNAIPLSINIEYPTLRETMKYWDMYTSILEKELPGLSEEALSADTPFNTPLGGKTLLDVLSFIALHEQYHIGQMSTIRRVLGHSAMSFM